MKTMREDLKSLLILLQDIHQNFLNQMRAVFSFHIVFMHGIWEEIHLFSRLYKLFHQCVIVLHNNNFLTVLIPVSEFLEKHLATQQPLPGWNYFDYAFLYLYFFFFIVSNNQCIFNF